MHTRLVDVVVRRRWQPVRASAEARERSRGTGAGYRVDDGLEDRW